VSACCSAYSDAAEQQFDAHKVAQELAAYRKNGPGPTTRLLREGLVNADLVHGVLLDIGAGLGTLTFDLLERGQTRAVAVDASSSYLAAAADEARRRGQCARVELVHGDFVQLAATLPCADVVTLDRVVCCYPDVEPLLTSALEHAARTLALSYPRGIWYVRAVIAFDNLRRRIAGNAFRTCVHSPVLMERMIREAGLTLASRRATWMWSVDVFARPTQASAPDGIGQSA
jgi:magnesium-protoporphyrin O-methyltransferase